MYQNGVLQYNLILTMVDLKALSTPHNCSTKTTQIPETYQDLESECKLSFTQTILPRPITSTKICVLTMLNVSVL